MDDIPLGGGTSPRVEITIADGVINLDFDFLPQASTAGKERLTAFFGEECGFRQFVSRQHKLTPWRHEELTP